ncbi:hypothetical protein FG05_35207 [Fusarium graminearum]|nr:hypothetical protein FG05_35207 [Fusarium graminearum]
MPKEGQSGSVPDKYEDANVEALAIAGTDTALALAPTEADA